jgi:hypothetical protein
MGFMFVRAALKPAEAMLGAIASSKVKCAIDFK